MALLDVGSVVASVAALLDDPSQSSIDQDYVIPFLNLRWANLVVNLAMLGLQFSEEEVIFLLPAGSLTLAPYMANGQPLASMMEPVSIDWKNVGADDTLYYPSEPVRELDDQPQGSQGVLQYSFKGGTVLLTPSSIDQTIRVRFKAMSTTLVDPTDNMIRGVGDIIAFRTAELIYAIRGNVNLQKTMQAYGDTALDDFITLGVLRDQANFYQIQPTHRRGIERPYVAMVLPGDV